MSEAAVPTADAGSRLAMRARRRPEPGFGHVLGAAAGAFAVVAIVAFVVAVASSDPTAPGVGFDAGLAVAALVLGFWAPGPLRSAAVTILVLTVPIIWFFALFGSGSAGRSELRGLYLLTLGTYLVLYFVGWTRGRAILLAGALLFLASWITFEVAGDNATLVPFQNQVSTPFTFPGSGTGSTSGSGSTSSGTINFTSQNSSDDASTAAAAIGLALLVVGAVLDRRKLAGAATPFIAVGALEAIAGAVTLGGNNGVLAGGLFAVAAGAVVGMVGAQGEGRRGSTWIGVLTIFGGLIAVLVDISPTSAGAIGGIAFGFAVGLALIAVWIAPRLGEADDGGIAPRRGDDGSHPDDGPVGGAPLVTADAKITAAEALPGGVAPAVAAPTATGPALEPGPATGPALEPGPATGPALEPGPAAEAPPDAAPPAGWPASQPEPDAAPELGAPTDPDAGPDDRRPSD